MKRIKNYISKELKNKKGGMSIPMIPMVIAFVVSIIMCVEYFIMVSSLNDIQLIMDIVANGALRAGVVHDIHKDENIIGTDASNNIDLTSMDIPRIRQTYSDLLWENLERSVARNSLQDIDRGINLRNSFVLMQPGTGAYVEDTTFLTNPASSNSPIIRLEKTQWSNTHSNSNRELDTVVLDAVARVRLKTSNMIPRRVIEYTFTRKEDNGTTQTNNTTFTVEVVNDDTESGFTTLIVRSSTRMILK